jgi:hypothetical protein
MPNPFFGRQDELALLQSLFGQVAARDGKGRSVDGPRMAVIVAHTGVGKTRLAQELYRWLASHPKWDAGDFWPDDLGSERDSLRVNPIVEPSAATPQFLWWGMRACNHADRNATAAAAIVEDQVPLCHLAVILSGGRALGGSLLATGVDLVKDAVLPTGLAGALKLGKQLIELRRGRRRSSADSEKAARETLADEMLKDLQSLAASKLPMVVLCDDMQWVDAESLAFVQRLWALAHEQRWPLLVVATHWETEWNQACRLPVDARMVTFARFAGQPGVHVVPLQYSPSKDLAAWLRHELVGLTPKQVDLLVEKAGSNFLQLVQNVQPLKRRAETYFEEGRLDRPLNRRGEAYVGSFETDPVRRARQVFDELSESMQLVLGWSSHIGMRFVREVVVDFAHAMGVRLEQEPAATIDEATDPMALLALAGEHAREFRQGAFHQQAQRVLGLHGYDKATLDAALRQVLVEWIQRSFDDEGDIVCPEDGRAVAALPEQEQRELLVWAIDLLPISAAVDWEDASHCAAVRARVLLDSVADATDGSLAALHCLVDDLWGVATIPNHVLSEDGKEWLRGTLYLRQDGCGAFLALWSHGQFGEDAQPYLDDASDRMFEKALSAGDQSATLAAMRDYMMRRHRSALAASLMLGRMCAARMIVDRMLLAAVKADVAQRRDEYEGDVAQLGVRHIEMCSALLGQVFAVEGEGSANDWLAGMLDEVRQAVAGDGCVVCFDAVAAFFAAKAHTPSVGFERVRISAFRAGLSLLDGASSRDIGKLNLVAQWHWELAEMLDAVGDKLLALRHHERAVECAREWIARLDGSGMPRYHHGNDMCWYACRLAALHLRLQRESDASAALDVVRHEIPALVHASVRSCHFLDTAATFFELRSQALNALSDPSAAEAAAKSAHDLRSRIAALSLTDKH